METEVVRRQLRNSHTGGAAEQTYRHLPEEIIEEILPKLPVKSLLRFKCVSKSWRCLISSKSFVKTHLGKSKKNESFAHHRIISPTPKSLDDFSVHSLLIEPVTHAISYPLMDNSTEPVIVGCCNGLICVLVDRCWFVLWNPSTKECKKVPDFCRNLKYLRECSLISMHGFGFDESRGDYKILAVFYTFNFSDTSPHMRRVYSLKAGSWIGGEFFKNGSPLDDVRGDLVGKFANGNLHWMINREWELKWEIVFFDLKSETFGLVEQPSFMEGYDRPKLGVLKECLCVFSESPQTFGFDIWIQKEYGVEDSWSKLMTISCLSQISWNHSLVKSLNHVRPLLVLQRDEVLFRYGSGFYICSAKNDWVRQLHIDNIGDISHFCDAEVYVESLVSLKRDDDDQQA